MSKFVYRMQNILNLKYKLEEQAKLDLQLQESDWMMSWKSWTSCLDVKQRMKKRGFGFGKRS